MPEGVDGVRLVSALLTLNIFFSCSTVALSKSEIFSKFHSPIGKTSTKWSAHPYLEIDFYIGSPVPNKFECFRYNFVIVLIFTVDDFYLYTLHTHIKRFFIYLPEVPYGQTDNF